MLDKFPAPEAGNMPKLSFLVIWGFLFRLGSHKCFPTIVFGHFDTQFRFPSPEARNTPEMNELGSLCDDFWAGKHKCFKTIVFVVLG